MFKKYGIESMDYVYRMLSSKKYQNELFIYAHIQINAITFTYPLGIASDHRVNLRPVVRQYVNLRTKVKGTILSECVCANLASGTRNWINGYLVFKNTFVLDRVCMLYTTQQQQHHLALTKWILDTLIDLQGTLTAILGCNNPCIGSNKLLLRTWRAYLSYQKFRN